jgi:lipopolysaccharide transport system permease protein
VQNLWQLAIYTFVFSGVFKAKWQDSQIGGQQVAFAPTLFLGLVLFNLFSESVGRAPSLIVSNANYVKRVVFPVDILPIITVGSALFNAVIGLCVLIVLAIAFSTPLEPTVVWLPLTFLPVVLLALGVSWFLASLGVFVRDVSEAVGLLLTGLMFFSPIFYPAAALPEKWRWLLLANPLSIPIEQARSVALYGHMPDLLAIGYVTALGLAAAYFGWVWFQVTRRGFADVI